MGVFQALSKHKHAFLVSAIVNCGSMLFGFETGIAGAVIALHSFKEDFNLAADATKYASLSSNIVAVFSGGAFFGAAFPPFLTKHIGRRRVLSLAGSLLLLGGILQVAAQAPSLAMIYAGRVLCGFGIGIISNLSPVYIAECAPKEYRGLMMGMFEMFLVSGGLLSYWTTYGTGRNLPASSEQWRVPLSLQVILAFMVTVGSFFVCESPRWLAKAGRYEDAERSLCYLRSSTPEDPMIQVELAEIKAQIQEEIAATEGRSWKELFIGANLRRLFWGLGVATCSIWCGHNAILYYGPSVFAEIGFSSQDASLFASGMITVVKFCMTILFLAAGVQIFGRRTLLMTGALLMSIFVFALGGILATNPPGDGANNTPAGHAMMAMIYLFMAAYSISWGPLSWVYIGEMFPTRIRDIGVAICVMTVWLMNYALSKSAPTAILKMGWKYWMFLGTMNALCLTFAWFLPETRGKTLEELDVVFGVVAEEDRQRDIEVHYKAEGLETNMAKA